MFHCMYTPHFVYPFIHRWTFELFGTDFYVNFSAGLRVILGDVFPLKAPDTQSLPDQRVGGF